MTIECCSNQDRPQFCHSSRFCYSKSSRDFKMDSSEVASRRSETSVVTSGHTLVPGLYSVPMKPSVASKEISRTIQIHVVDGILRPVPAFDHWICHVAVATDCRTQNVEIQRSQANRAKLRLKVINPIPEGETLRFWFAEELLAALEMPFLTPKNIRGDGIYACHHCSSTYDAPNPLKLHLYMNCKDYKMADVWSCIASRLQTSLSSTLTPFHSSPFPSLSLLYSNLTSLPQPMVSASSITLTTTNTSRISTNRSPTSFPYLPPPQPLPTSPSITPADCPAQVETLVSNLGRSKHGHVCLYCGKMYSRKYGLKIHIRTHTGYKPLRCQICLRPFGDPSNLNKHIRLHAEGHTPYRCEHCGKVLVRRRDLDRHLKSRHPNLPNNSTDSENMSSPSTTVDTTHSSLDTHSPKGVELRSSPTCETVSE